MTRQIFVTGASAGIGRALATEAVGRGEQVWGVARRVEELTQLQRTLPAGRFQYSRCDVTQEADVLATLRAMQQQPFVPDVVVLNAGINEHDLLPHYNHGSYTRIMRTNVDGVMVWVEHLLPQFLARGTGQFIAISSISAYLTHARGAAYGASKAALTSTFLSLHKRYRRDGLTFTTAHLGPVRTAMWHGGRFPLVLSAATVARKLLRAMDTKPMAMDLPWILACAARLTQHAPGLM